MLLTYNFLSTPTNTISCHDLLVSSGRSTDDALKTISTTGFTNITASNVDFEAFTYNSLSFLLSKYPEVFEDIDTVLVVTQSYMRRMPAISSRIQHFCGLSEECFCEDIIDGCSGLIKAIEVVKGLFSIGRKKALVISGDLNSTLTKKSDVSSQILFGDGLTYQIFEASIASNSTELSIVKSRGDSNFFLSCEFTDPTLEMNGFEIFRFTRNCVPSLLKDFTGVAGRTLDSYDFLVFHQASLLVVNSLAKLCAYSSEFNAFNCSEIGNIGSGSIGAWLANETSIETNCYYNFLAVGFGSGLSFGVADLECNLIVNEHFHV